MLTQGEAADVHFLVGEERELFPAHKQILCGASDVFEAMFRFDAKNGKSENASADCPVEVPDIGANAFRVMLSFIYAEDTSELNGQNAIAVLYAAKKYNICGLLKVFLEFPIGQLPDVFLSIDQIRLLNENSFANRCFDYIDQNAETLLHSDAFLQIDQNLLCEIIESDQLKIDGELSVWNAALRWADEKCLQNGTECSPGNRRAALGPALFKIRFPLIPSETFAKKIVPSGVLTAEEFDGVRRLFCSTIFHGLPGAFPLKFPSRARICDWNITPRGNIGTIAMEIQKFSEFAQKDEGGRRTGKAMPIGGLPWQILAQIKMKNFSEKWLGFFLRGGGAKKGDSWSCICSATFRIISTKKGTKDLCGKRNDRIFDNKSKGWGFFHFISFAELMDPDKGFYDKEEDKVTLAIEIIVKKENAEKIASVPNKSNGKIVLEIGKLSEFAREILMSERSSETVQIKGLPWKICALIVNPNKSNQKYLAFYLFCAAPKDENWSCKCSATLQIVSQKGEAANFTAQFKGRVFNNKLNNLAFPNCIPFAQLMDPGNGFYDESEDKVSLTIDVTVEEQKGTKRKLHSPIIIIND